MKGIDISKHNTGLDFAKLRSAGIDFAMIRAGYGGIVDARFMQHYTAAKKAGLKIGVYWFCYSINTDDAVEEAEDCLKAIKGLTLDLPVFYDFEYDTERYAKERGVIFTPKLRTDIICAFCERIKSAGYEPGIYTNPDYWLYRLVRGRVSDYKLWLAAWRRSDGIADFGTTSPDDLPDKYKDAMIWQFGKCSFGGRDVDINYGYFNPIYNGGGQYTIKSGDTYTSGRAVPARLIGKSFTIAKVKPDRLLLGEIMSWVGI